VSASASQAFRATQRLTTTSQALLRPSRISYRQRAIDGLLQELLLVAPDEAEEDVSMIDEAPRGGVRSIGENLARLYRIASSAERHVTLSKQVEIRSWYNYGEEFENRVSEISSSRRVTDKTARSNVYKEIMPHLFGITQQNLRTKTHKARNIYRLFREIGVNRIRSVKSYSADFISSLTVAQIDLIVGRVVEIAID
jgi:hypothetical protein